MKVKLGLCGGVVVAALAVCLVARPAFAGDDGQASIVTGIATTFGIFKEDSPNIDFRERGRLVLPPKMTLPPPGQSASKDPNWPVDVENAREKKRKKMEDAEPSAKDRSSRNWRFFRPGDDVKVTTSGLDNAGPACRNPDPKTGDCPEHTKPGMNWNPLTWVGLEKKPQSTLGPEPDRESLIDPPRGYRAPAEGVGAKIDN